MGRFQTTRWHGLRRRLSSPLVLSVFSNLLRSFPVYIQKRLAELEAIKIANEMVTCPHCQRTFNKVETYSRIGLLRSHGNFQWYWTTRKLWKLKVLDYYEAMETYSRIGLLRIHVPQDAGPRHISVCQRLFGSGGGRLKRGSGNTVSEIGCRKTLAISKGKNYFV